VEYVAPVEYNASSPYAGQSTSNYNGTILYNEILVYSGGAAPIGSDFDPGDRPRKKTKIFIARVPEDIEDMKLSVILAQKLTESINANASLLRMNAEMEMRKNIEAQSHPTPQPRIQKPVGQQVTINRVIPAPPVPELKVNPAQHMVLLRRLEQANAAKAEKRQQEEARSQERLKNLAKARRVAKKNRSKT